MLNSPNLDADVLDEGKETSYIFMRMQPIPLTSNC